MKIAAIILAAGLSRRMGVPKPLLPVGTEPAVLRCARLVKAAGAEDVLIVTGHLREETEAVFMRCDAPEVRFIHNDSYRDGMYSSIVAGAKGLTPDTDGFFLLPADCCAVSKDTLTALIEKLAGTDGCVIVRPKLGGQRGHPPLIPGKFRPALLEYGGENGMRGFLNTCPFELIYPEDPGILLDMDTPEAYAELLQYLKLPIYPSAGECAGLFAKYNTPERIIEHGEHVAEIALKLARGMILRGAELDLGLLEAACILHDILRMEKDHARAGMELLLREGYPGAAVLVGEHMDGPAGEILRIGESELLFLADKLCRRGKLAAIEETLGELTEKYKDDPEALKKAKERMTKAKALMDTLKTQYGTGCEESDF